MTGQPRCRTGGRRGSDAGARFLEATAAAPGRGRGRGRVSDGRCLGGKGAQGSAAVPVAGGLPRCCWGAWRSGSAGETAALDDLGVFPSSSAHGSVTSVRAELGLSCLVSRRSSGVLFRSRARCRPSLGSSLCVCWAAPRGPRSPRFREALFAKQRLSYRDSGQGAPESLQKQVERWNLPYRREQVTQG